MSFQALLTTLLLPPLLLTLLALAAALLAWRGRRGFALLAALSMAAQLALATPIVADGLRASLERELPAPEGPAPQAIIVLGAEAARAQDAIEVGALTLERLRAGARLARATGLPLLVTAGPLQPDEPPLARLMAESLAADFGTPARWIEAAARDTRENATLSAAMLRAEGVGAAFVVTHAWHMKRALEAFARTPLVVLPAPVRLDRARDGRLTDFVPSATRLAESWYYVREWAGRLVYRLRDGAPR